ERKPKEKAPHPPPKSLPPGPPEPFRNNSGTALSFCLSEDYSFGLFPKRMINSNDVLQEQTAKISTFLLRKPLYPADDQLGNNFSFISRGNLLCKKISRNKDNIRMKNKNIPASLFGRINLKHGEK
ncbi:hypothetical protein, partial [uncultured Akkermansia sp.]